MTGWARLVPGRRSSTGRLYQIGHLQLFRSPVQPSEPPRSAPKPDHEADEYEDSKHGCAQNYEHDTHDCKNGEECDVGPRAVLVIPRRHH